MQIIVIKKEKNYNDNKSCCTLKKKTQSTLIYLHM